MPKPKKNTTEVIARPENDRRQRRHFSAEDKARILKEADACKRGELGALLRREGIYSSHLSTWRQQLEQRGLEGLAPAKPGRKPTKDAKDRRIEELEKRTAKLEKELRISRALIEMQAEDRGERGRLVELVRRRPEEVAMSRACKAIGLSRATAYRHLRPKPRTESARRPHSHRRIPDNER